LDLAHLLIWLIFFCLIAGLVFYALQFVPVPPPFKNIIIIAVCLLLILILLNFMGVLGAPLRIGAARPLALDLARAA
jgi:hypothetical protein